MELLINCEELLFLSHLNIAEGASRKSGAERKGFYEIARSSLVEIDTQLEISIKIRIL